MGFSILHTGPSLQVKIAYQDGTEKTIGYATGLNYTVLQGQKPIMVVDNPFPAEIAQGAAPSMVQGTLNILLPKGCTPESMGLVAYRRDASGAAYMPLSRYFHLRVYDRATSGLVFSCDFVKVGQYSMGIAARRVVQCDLAFTGMFLTPGNTA